jgi:hypothetical protein
MHSQFVEPHATEEDFASGMSHLVVVADTDLATDAFRRAVEDDDPAWIGGRVPAAAAPAGMSRHLTGLGLHVVDHGGALVRKAAFVDIGPLRTVGDGFEVEIGWCAATLAPLFPVFAGRLAVAEGQLRIEGWYAPPGGFIGRVADRMLLNLAARGTARWLLAALADVVRSREARVA